MKKLFLLIITTCTASLGAWAQTSSVSATITDSTSQAYANGTYDILFRPAPGVPGNSTQNGSAFTKHFSGVLDASGAFAVTLTRNDFVQPGGSQWTFTICPLAASACFTSNQTIAAASVNLTTPLHTVTPIVSVFSLGNIPAAYSSSEIVVTPNPGSFFWNLTTGTFNFWNGASWVAMLLPSANNTFTGSNTFSGSTSTTSDFSVGTAVSGGILNVFHIIRPIQPAPQAPTSFPLGNDLFLSTSGSADLWSSTAALNLTTTTSVSPGTSTVTITACALGAGSCSGSLTSQLCPPSATCGLVIDPYTSVQESISSANWSIVDGTHLQILFANSHTQPYTIRQQGSIAFNTNRLVIQADDQKPLFIQERNLDNIARLPGNVNDTFPDNAFGFGVPLTGISLTQAKGHSDLVFRANTSTDCTRFKTSAGANEASFCEALLTIGNPISFQNGNTITGYSDAGVTQKFFISALDGSAIFNGQITSSIATGTAPFSIASTTPVANLTASKHPTISYCGTTTTCANTAETSVRIITGKVALTTGAATIGSITAFSGTANMFCRAQDETTPTNAASCVPASTSSLTLGGTGSDTISYAVIGW